METRLSACRKEHVSSEAVIIECVIPGTHGGAWRDLPATGRHIEFPLCGVYTFDEAGIALVSASVRGLGRAG